MIMQHLCEGLRDCGPNGDGDKGCGGENGEQSYRPSQAVGWVGGAMMDGKVVEGGLRPLDELG